MVLVDYDPFFWPDVKQGESLFIHKLSVIKIARKTGVADALIDFFKEQGAARGVKTLRLDTHALRPRLRAFYERHGFEFTKNKVFQGDRHTAFYVYTLPDLKTGWERDNRNHFDDIVVKYDKARWNYPDGLYADILNYSGTSQDKKAIEIGAGTGKATTPFLNAGYNVTAVEIGENMAAFLLDKFKGTNLNVINTSFEDAVLDENNYDVIYAASAFHWIDAEIGCPKVFRLLKNGGTFALFRNNAVQADGNELYDEIQTVYDKYYYSHYKKDDRQISLSKMTYEDFLKPAEIHRGFRFESLERYGFKDISMKLYEATRTYRADEYIALQETMSDHMKLSDDIRAALFAGIREAILKHGGRLQMNYLFQLYMGRKP